MGATSSAVKRKYNEKTYKRFTADIRNEEYDRIEDVRNELNLSRAEFLKMLLAFYEEHQEK